MQLKAKERQGPQKPGERLEQAVPRVPKKEATFLIL
jgi:hypothetical protein